MASKPNHNTLGHVAVVGGCGFLGYHMVSLILRQYPDSKVSALDIRTTNRHDDARVEYHVCDITDLSTTSDLFKKLKPDVVIHTAAVVPDPAIPKAVTHKINVEGTKNVLAAAKGAGVKAFVYTSSSSVVVGDHNEAVNADESWPVLTGKNQAHYYTSTKAMAEALVLEANRSTPTFLTASIRPAGIFGEYDTQLSYRPCLITGFKTYFQIGDNDNLFDCTYVENVAHAHLLAAKALLVTHSMATAPLDLDKVDGEAFFVTNGEPVYFWDLMRAFWAARGYEEDKVYNVKKVWVMNTTLGLIIATLLEIIMGLFGKKPNFDRNSVKQSTINRYFCIDKARLRLKYEPLVSLEEGIRRAVSECMVRINREKEKKTQ